MEMEKEVRKILDQIRPYLNRDGGDLEFVKLEDGIVYIKMLGACVGCALIDTTLYDGIERILVERVPGVIAVVAI
ncbi:MAG TPA: NifU family protein [Acholeplasmataceae bacterium]|jgi:Fe-S cluster biogenesis protein NfuA|nr:NifU family protein [Acholeplasmataceae bacterium]